MFGLSSVVKLNPKAFEDLLAEKLGVPAESVAPLVSEIVTKIQNIKLPKKISDFSQFVQSSLALKSSVEKVVVLVETSKTQLKALTSEQKKDLAVDLLDALFVFPLPLEMVDHTVFSILVTFIVDEFNTRFGKVWTEEQLKSVVGK